MNGDAAVVTCFLFFSCIYPLHYGTSSRKTRQHPPPKNEIRNILSPLPGCIRTLSCVYLESVLLETSKYCKRFGFSLQKNESVTSILRGQNRNLMKYVDPKLDPQVNGHSLEGCVWQWTSIQYVLCFCSSFKTNNQGFQVVLIPTSVFHFFN